MGSTLPGLIGLAPRKRIANPEPVDLNAVEMSLEQARILAGQIVTAAMGGTPLKTIADKGQVSRWCAGAENPNLAKLIASAERRKAMAKALLRSCRGVRVREVIEIEEGA